MERRLDRVLRRHGDHWFERERAGVTPLEAGNQLGLGIAPSDSRSKAMSALGARLPGKVEPIESRNEIAGTGARTGFQATGRHLEPGQRDGLKAAERVIKALDQRR